LGSFEGFERAKYGYNYIIKLAQEITQGWSVLVNMPGRMAVRIMEVMTVL
jgi:hypothetical protein